VNGNPKILEGDDEGLREGHKINVNSYNQTTKIYVERVTDPKAHSNAIVEIERVKNMISIKHSLLDVEECNQELTISKKNYT